MLSVRGSRICGRRILLGSARSSVPVSAWASTTTTTPTTTTPAWRRGRGLVTSAQKRALNKQQTSGEGVAGAEPGKRVVPPVPPPPPAGGGSATKAAVGARKHSGAPLEGGPTFADLTGRGGKLGGGKEGRAGGTSVAAPLFALTAVVVGGAYFGFPRNAPQTTAAVVEAQTTAATTAATTTTDPAALLEGGDGKGAPNLVTKKTTEKEPTVTDPTDKKERPVSTGNTGNMVAKKEETTPPPPPTIEHAKDGNRVDVALMNASFLSAVNDRRRAEEEAATVAKETAAAANALAAAKAQAHAEAQAAAAKPKPAATAEEALSELLSDPESNEHSRTLRAARAALRSDMDEVYFQDLDELTPAELKVRIIRLATEMTDKTKWEAVRLKEFLVMKEKEVGERYLEILQKQRLEFESLLGQKLRQQEDDITRRANAALQTQDESSQLLLSAQKDAQDAERQDVIQTETKRITLEVEAAFRQKMDEESAKAKAGHAKELDSLGSKFLELRTRAESLGSRLEVSGEYEKGSRRAHRISAASLALATKLEGGESAAVELAALKGAAGDEGVIASAASMIPASIATGVPTVADLQATFDETYRVARQAAMVPEGRHGLDGQLLGMLFAKLTLPPSPDAAVPASDNDGENVAADVVLSAARGRVALGDIDGAVQLLEKLKGQAAWAVRGWKSGAKDRVSTERAVKVIKLECALMNKDLVGVAGA